MKKFMPSWPVDIEAKIEDLTTKIEELTTACARFWPKNSAAPTVHSVYIQQRSAVMHDG